MEAQTSENLLVDCPPLRVELSKPLTLQIYSECT